MCVLVVGCEAGRGGGLRMSCNAKERGRESPQQPVRRSPAEPEVTQRFADWCRCRAGGRGMSEMGTGCERRSVRAHSRGSRVGEDPFGCLHGNEGAPKRICGREARFRVTAGWGRGDLQPFAFSRRGRAESHRQHFVPNGRTAPSAFCPDLCSARGSFLTEIIKQRRETVARFWMSRGAK